MPWKRKSSGYAGYSRSGIEPSPIYMNGVMMRDAQARVVARIDAVESLGDESVPVQEPLEVKQPLGMVASMRLTLTKWKALYAEAKALGTVTTPLARMWVLKDLRASGALGRRSGATAARKAASPET